MQKDKKEKGFTLVEFLFVAFTLALFMTALFKITRGGLRAYQRGVVQTELKHELRNIVDLVTTDVHQAAPNSFSVPNRTYSGYTLHPQLSFDRYKYTADNTVPQANITLIYNMSPTTPDLVVGPTTYRRGRLTRTVIDPLTSITSQNLTNNCIYSDNSSGSFEVKTAFMWDVDPYSGGTSNLDTIKFQIKLYRTHSGSNEPETIENTVKVSLRASKGLLSNSNYYPPTSTADPYANVQRFGNPTSLVRP